MDSMNAGREMNMVDVLERARRAQTTAANLVDRAETLRAHVRGHEPKPGVKEAQSPIAGGSLLYDMDAAVRGTEEQLEKLCRLLETVSASLGAPPPGLNTAGATIGGPRLARG